MGRTDIQRKDAENAEEGRKGDERVQGRRDAGYDGNRNGRLATGEESGTGPESPPSLEGSCHF